MEVIKKMNIALIDIDRRKSKSKAQRKQPFPTLTLMKLSAWHKAKGDTVSLISPDEYLEGNMFNQYDKTYASCIFTWNKPIAERLARWCNNKFVFGACKKFEEYCDNWGGSGIIKPPM